MYMKKEIIEIIEDEHGDIECLCGNIPSSQGFFPCNENGEDVEPVSGWNGLYRCDGCGRIIRPIPQD